MDAYDRPWPLVEGWLAPTEVAGGGTERDGSSKSSPPDPVERGDLSCARRV
jgi:hypothetical protein